MLIASPAAALDAFQRGIVALDEGRLSRDDARLAAGAAHLARCLEWAADAQLRAEAHIALGDAWLARAAPDAATAARHYRRAADLLLALILGGEEQPR